MGIDRQARKAGVGGFRRIISERAGMRHLCDQRGRNALAPGALDEKTERIDYCDWTGRPIGRHDEAGRQVLAHSRHGTDIH
jgi:hypothetical protein